jgi:prepilin-type N-terminal cleavage/methylation domain-containing protein
MKTFFYTKTARDQQGFTLIEVLIAIVVFGIGIMAVSKMATQGFNSFSKAGRETVEVNRDIKNIDTLKCTLYTNSQIFNSGGQGPSQYPVTGSADQADIRSWDFNNVVLASTKFIAVQDSAINGPSVDITAPVAGTSVYRLYIIKSQRTQVN